jgi:hypothetical protein
VSVLILAKELDASVDAMIPALAERGVRVHRINTGWFPTRMQFTAELRGRWRGRLTSPRGPVELDEVTAVWYRSPGAYAMPSELSPGEAQHAPCRGQVRSRRRAGFPAGVVVQPPEPRGRRGLQTDAAGQSGARGADCAGHGVVRFVDAGHSYGKDAASGAMVGYIQSMEVPDMAGSKVG